MKKLVNLALVLILVVCLATTAFAAPVGQYPEIVDGVCTIDPTLGTAFLSVEADAMVTVNVPDGMGGNLSVYGYYGDDFVNGGYTIMFSRINQVPADENGEVTGTLEDNMFMIMNTSGAALYLYVTVEVGSAGPVAGTWDNPAEMVLGTNTAEIPENSGGYYYNWIATDYGVLTITMPTETDWFCTITNLGADRDDWSDDVYGDSAWSDSDPAMNPVCIGIKPGDIVQIIIDTYNPDPMVWSTPAGTITFTAEIVDHVFEHHEAADPGCHTNGNIEYWYCQYCDCYFVEDDQGNLINSNARNVTIPADNTLEHHEYVAPTCVSDGMQEYWYCAGCDCFFYDAEGTIKVDDYLELTILADSWYHDLQYSEEVGPGCHVNGMKEHFYCKYCDCYFVYDDDYNLVNTNAKNLAIPAEKTLQHFPEIPVTCVSDGMMEHWYCDECDCFFTDAAGMYNIAYLSLVVPADGTDHNFEHHEAADAVCHRNGNVEYWYCADCDCYFVEDDNGNKINTTSKNVVILAESTLEHHEKVEAGCHINGMEEYWYCAKCDCFFTDAEGIFNIASKRLVILAETELEHHEEVPATSKENGMKEYWYCPDCDCYFTDAEGKYNIARLSLVIPAEKNPATGDMGTLIPTITALVSACGAAFVTSKKKFF